MIDVAAQRAQRATEAQGCDVALCPDADTLIAFVDGLLDEEVRAGVAARVAACATCAAAARVAINARGWADEVAGGLVHPSAANVVHSLARPARRPAWLPLAMAAGLMVLVGIGSLMRTPLEDTMRGSGATKISPADGAVLDAPPARLSWDCSDARTGAKVELLRADATPVWSGGAPDCGATLPPATRSGLVPGEYLWRVQDASGESLQGPYAFRVAP